MAEKVKMTGIFNFLTVRVMKMIQTMTAFCTLQPQMCNILRDCSNIVGETDLEQISSYLVTETSRNLIHPQTKMESLLFFIDEDMLKRFPMS